MSLPLPRGWTASPSAEGVIDLRVDARRRPVVVGAIAAVTLVWTGAMATDVLAGRQMPLAASPYLAYLVTIVLIAATLWCAFADECWRLSRGLVEHRVGWRQLTHVRRIEDGAATLVITVDFSTNFGKPYYRLHAIASGRRYFLIERDYGELNLLAGFIAAYTGWGLTSSS
jgi:hypothetical protein